ncbi:Bug family tripartite tricarboxylate transporter substrate binding protein [Cupriavidus basilensis]
MGSRQFRLANLGIHLFTWDRGSRHTGCRDPQDSCRAMQSARMSEPTRICPEGLHQSRAAASKHAGWPRAKRLYQTQRGARHAHPLIARQTLALAIAVVPLLSTAPAANAAEWPTKPVRIIVAAPPGGTADIVARLFANALQSPLGQTVIVDNKAGAAGTIGVHGLLSAPRDGYTFLLISARALPRKCPTPCMFLTYPFKDIVPIAQLTRQGLARRPSRPAREKPRRTDHVTSKRIRVRSTMRISVLGLRGQTIGVQFNRLAGLTTGTVSYKGRRLRCKT